MVLHKDYKEGMRTIPKYNYYTEFLEEGICEFVCDDMGEMIAFPEHQYLKPRDLDSDNRDSYEVKYRYSRQFIEPVMRAYGIRDAIYKLVTQPPPTEEEILNPMLFYLRLGIYYHEDY